LSPQYQRIQSYLIPKTKLTYMAHEINVRQETSTEFSLLSSDFLSLWLYSHLDLGPFLTFLIQYIVCRTKPVARPPPTHRTTQKNADIHTSSGIGTHDPTVRADEDGSCFRLRGHCDRLLSSDTGYKDYRM
jgi:hypothetical protein